MRIFVLVGLGEMPATLALEPCDDEIVGFPGRHQFAFELGPGSSHERAVGRNWTHQSQAVLHPGLEVIGAECGRHVHQTGAIVSSDEAARDYQTRCPVLW